MSVTTRELKDRLKKVQRLTIAELRSLQATQSFSGALRVDPAKVFITERDGRRALDSLRKRLR